MKQLAVGIDLGTTNSVVAHLTDDGPVIIDNALGQALTPSAVYHGSDGLFEVGASARQRAVVSPERLATSFKLDMGSDGVRNLAGKTMTPVELSAMVLRSLKEDVERSTGEAVEAAVITVPAYFDEGRRQATHAAAELAGLKVLRIINEPTAAALAYGLNTQEEQQRVAVVDLGGGTFDVSILDMEDGVVEVCASAGDMRLGGDNFDALLYDLLNDMAADRGCPAATEPTLIERRKQAAIDSKHRLSSHDQVTVLWPGSDLELLVTRAASQLKFQPLADRMEKTIRLALSRAKLEPQAIDVVLLVGGSSRLPTTSELSRKIFRQFPQAGVNPDQAIAMGAAIQAGLVLGHQAVDDLVVTDVAPFSLGIETADHFGKRIVQGLFTPILERGTVLPASRVERFHTMHPKQTKLSVDVYQGDHAMCADNTLIGSYTLKKLPKKPAGEVAVDVRLTYDLSGLIEVDMQVVDSDITASLEIDRSQSNLTDKERNKRRDAMQKLKVHPRELLPNVHLRAQAEALHVELTGDRRAYLRDALGAFEGALQGQDPEEIAGTRQALTRLIEQLREGG